MSVLAGFWNFDGRPADPKHLAKLSNYLAEFGPDDERVHLEASVALAYRPFHTTLESRAEHQPYTVVRGALLTWDGRLDNRDELALTLSADLKADRTDAAIVAAAFERWDTECFGKLIGDWAIAVWDSRRRHLILARDYMGTRNLFYHRSVRTVSWSSHLSGLAIFGDSLSLNDEYVAGYLAFHPEADLTPYREIHSVSPGHFVLIKESEIVVQKHWRFNPRARINYHSDSDYEENFRTLFRQAVRRRLRTDSPILAELSGGLDSSSVVCMADSIIASDEAHVKSLDTFSCYDPEEPDEDDFSYFAEVEKQRGRIGFRAELHAAGDSFGLTYPTFVAIPCLGERREMKSARVRTMERGRYRVVLSGTGGDEFLGQAFDPRIYMADLLITGSLHELWNQLVAWSLPIRRPWIQLLLQAFSWFAPTAIRKRVTPGAKVEKWIGRRFSREQCLAELLLDIPKGSWRLLPSVRELMHTVPALGRQLTNSVPRPHEMRYPYLDQSLTEFLMSIPVEQLVRPGDRRSLMRRSLSTLLPRQISTRRTKAGTSRCYSLTLAKHWDDIEKDLNTLIIARLGYVDAREFNVALREMKNGAIPPTFVRLLRALVLEYWIRDVVERGIISMPDSSARARATVGSSIKPRSMASEADPKREHRVISLAE